MSKTVLHIASGESVAGSLKYNGIKNVYAFNEAMCEGEAAGDIGSPEFVRKREKAYAVKSNEYKCFTETLKPLLDNTDKLELYFDYDMFCAVNTITLLAYLEKTRYKGSIKFNLIEHDGTADIIKSFPIELGEFQNVYKTVLIDCKPYKTGIEHIDNGILLYLEYKSGENKITDYIQKNISKARTELCVEIISKFPEYGIGDISIFKMVDSIKFPN